MKIINDFSDMDSRDDFPALLNRFGLLEKGVEVGVNKGEYSTHLLKYWKGKKLYLVDSWRELKDYKDICDIDHNGHLNNLACTFMTIYDFGKRATIIRELSEDAANLFEDKSLDFVFIDADHSYKGCKNDISLWYPKVKSKGILCGHDYINSPLEENKLVDFGVKDAVDEFVKEKNLKLHIAYDGILIATEQPIYSWFIRK